MIARLMTAWNHLERVQSKGAAVAAWRQHCRRPKAESKVVSNSLNYALSADP